MGALYENHEMSRLIMAEVIRQQLVTNSEAQGLRHGWL
jgi:hypothetical protein